MIRSRQSIKKNVLWCLGLLLVLVIFSTGCDQAGAKGKYTPGVYMAEAKGHNGVIEVEVTLSDSAITEVKVVSHSETSGVGDIALDRVSKSIVDKQTLAIDSISEPLIPAEQYWRLLRIALRRRAVMRLS